MKRNHYIGFGIALVIVGGCAFYAGTSYAKNQVPSRGQFNATFTAGGAGGAAGFTTRGGARGVGGFTAGQIISASDGSISIKQQNGSSTQIVLISPTTQILKSAMGTKADLTTGTEVTIMGSANSDGSMTATSIQIRPSLK